MGRPPRILVRQRQDHPDQMIRVLELNTCKLTKQSWFLGFKRDLGHLSWLFALAFRRLLSLVQFHHVCAFISLKHKALLTLIPLVQCLPCET